MRTPFKDTERATAQDIGEQEDLHKTSSLESDEAHTDAEQSMIPEGADVQGDISDNKDASARILDDAGNDISEGEEEEDY